MSVRGNGEPRGGPRDGGGNSRLHAVLSAGVRTGMEAENRGGLGGTGRGMGGGTSAPKVKVGRDVVGAPEWVYEGVHDLTDDFARTLYSSPARVDTYKFNGDMQNPMFSAFPSWHRQTAGVVSQPELHAPHPLVSDGGLFY